MIDRLGLAGDKFGDDIEREYGHSGLGSAELQGQMCHVREKSRGLNDLARDLTTAIVGLITGAQRVKPISLPSSSSITVDMVEVSSGHIAGGARVSPMKSLFPEVMTEAQVGKKQFCKHTKPARRCGLRVRASRKALATAECQLKCG